MKTAKPNIPANSEFQQTSGMTDESSHGLRKLLEEQIKDMYWVEKALVKALPKMQKKSNSEELQNAMADHLVVTVKQVARLEQVFEIWGKRAVGKKCEAMAGLLKEADEIMSETEDDIVRDAGIIAAAQKVEHYETASYGTLCALARTLGEMQVAALLTETLIEEKYADETLTLIAESSLYENAL